jgi:putative hemolysin
VEFARALSQVRGLCHHLIHEHGAGPEWEVRPHRPLPMPAGASLQAGSMPPLVKGYLACGAKVLGAPAVDPDFGCADVPMWLRLADVPPGYRRRFLKAEPVKETSAAALSAAA